MCDEYYTTKMMKDEYSVSESVSKKIAGRASKYIVNFGDKVDRAWRFNFREVAFILSVVTFNKKLTEDESFSRNMDLFYGIDCNRSNHRI